jgi:uncharacterized damage-inducible protein DinB
MTRWNRALVPAFVLLAICAAPALAEESGIKAEMLASLRDARDKIIQLAEATPEAKYKYRPGKGVRSTGEVFVHVVGGNYFIPTFLGVSPPEGVNPRELEKTITKKADIVQALKDSFAHAEKAIAGASDAEMDRKVELFGGYIKTTVRGAHLVITSHAHEHLGQSIAYARANGIKPPWSEK